MAQQDVIKYLLKLEDQMSDGMQLTAQRADDLEGKLEELTKENAKGAKADKARRSSLQQLGKGFGLAAKAAAATASAFGVMGGLAIKTSANLEKFETRLGGLLGGLDKGKARVQELFELSARTPFSITGLVESEATLEAFGVNAQRVRGGVMDLAGAMGLELNDAAEAVGRALAGGAGAADVLRDKGVLAMVEVSEGMAVTEMTTNQFREALVRTLETNEKLAGGTAKLATTFAGLFSTLKDQFTVFSKNVGDADLFSTAKATLVVLLEVMEENKQAVGDFAAAIGGGLAKAIVFVVDSFFRLLALIEQAKIGFTTLRNIVRVLAIALGEMVLSAMQGLANLPLVGPKIAEGIGGAMAATEADIGRMNRELHKTADAIDEAREKQKAFLDMGQDVVTRIESMADGFQKAADAAGDIEAPETSDAIMTMVGVDKKAIKDSESAQKALDSFVGKLDGMRDKFRAAGMAVSDQTKESDKLQFRLDKLAASFAAAQAQAADLGPEAVAAFREVEEGMIASMSAIAAAIPQARREERNRRIGEGLSRTADALSSGGLSVLAGAGPIGAGAASLIGFGQQGDQAFDAAVAETAQEAADERAAALEEQRDQLKEQGASEAELAAAGLSDEDIAAAGEVTAADISQAESETDRGEIMGEIAADAVRGVIDGIKSLLIGLPDIVDELLPVILFELPIALAKSLVKMAQGTAKRLLVDLPSAFAKGLGDWWRRTWALIKDFFSFGFQTGGYVNRTGMALVHQGERVIPSNGAGTGTATAGLQAFMGQPSTNLTINTATVDPDSIPALGRLLERDLGAHGRVENDLFGTVAPFTSL